MVANSQKHPEWGREWEVKRQPKCQHTTILLNSPVLQTDPALIFYSWAEQSDAEKWHWKMSVFHVMYCDITNPREPSYNKQKIAFLLEIHQEVYGPKHFIYRNGYGCQCTHEDYIMLLLFATYIYILYIKYSVTTSDTFEFVFLSGLTRTLYLLRVYLQVVSKSILLQ